MIPPSIDGPSAARRALPDLALGLAIQVGVTGATWGLFDLPATYLALSLALYAGLAILLALQLPADSVGPGLGAANRVTLARSTLVVAVTPLVAYPAVHTEGIYWWTILLGTVAMVLDGVDGRVARRTGGSSSFGARFDMELDAFLIFVLSMIVWQSGKVGFWVILIGAMRYGFVLASYRWPALGAELPPSGRRKTVCVLQGVALLVCLGPIIPGPLAVMVAAAALASLVYSFGADIRWALAARVPPG